MLADLLIELGIPTKKVSATEYHSPCPVCGGTDRFIIWTQKKRYWCRKCKIYGDAIDFLQQFMGLPFHEARERVLTGKISNNDITLERSPFEPRYQSKTWLEKAREFVYACHKRLLVDSSALMDLQKERSLSLTTIKKNMIGLSPVIKFPLRSEWGLSNEDDRKAKLLIPPGILVPAFEPQNTLTEERVVKLKIRRNDWSPGSKFGKYHILTGSKDIMPVFGNLNSPTAIIVESEFDALIIEQELEETCCIATCGASKRPSQHLTLFLKRKKRILFSLDFDDAGKKEYPWWKLNFPNCRAWPAPYEKSVADAFVKREIDLKAWYLEGVHR